MHSPSRSLIALTQGASQPSTRYRWRQYVPELESAGFRVTQLESAVGAYAPAGSLRRAPWLASSLAENCLRALRTRSADLVFLQRELTATLLTWEWLLKRPFVFDVDDAIFSRARGRSADRIATQAAITICGNRFLAEHFAAFGEVVVIPTAVDDELFCPLKRPQQSTVPVVIGWSGSSSGFEYLYMVEDAIQSVLDQIEGAIFKVVSDRSPEFGILDPRRVVFERWSPAREVEVLREFTVGLMPLRDSVWARGKCSYKMLTYMAVGIPVVVSPVGMNVDVLSHGACGYPAKTRDEWIDALLDILRNPSGAEAMGLIGRRIVEARYSKRVIAPQLIQVLGGI